VSSSRERVSITSRSTVMAGSFQLLATCRPAVGRLVADGQGR